MTIRRSDWVQWLTIVTLFGFIWTAFAKAQSWEQAAKDISELKPKVINHDIQFAVIVEKIASIDKHLQSIDNKIK